MVTREKKDTKPDIETDVLVVGSGIAGSSAALGAYKEGAEVTVVTKASRPEESNTKYAQGGIATLGKEDSVEEFKQDILEAGHGESDPEAVELLVEEGSDAVKDVLIDEAGVDFDTNGDGYDLTKEAAHSNRRILHNGDATGKAVERSLISYIDEETEIDVLQSHMALELLGPNGRAEEGDEIRGVLVMDLESEQVFVLEANATILATGGIGDVYGHTTNPPGSTGDGIGMAALVGAEFENMEYVQFHPTVHAEREFLLSESLRGEGAKLVDENRERFMPEYHESAELAPRDIVATAVEEERENGEVYLDINPLQEEFDFSDKFPNAYSNLTEEEFETGLVPVKPAEHFLCGGIKVDDRGRTSIPRLYAVGETACTGVHGANRLASTSLLEGLTWGLRAGRDASEREKVGGVDAGEAVTEFNQRLPKNFCDAKYDRLQEIMWNRVGLKRNNRELRKARENIQRLRGEVRSYVRGRVDPELYSLQYSTVVATLITHAAIENDESVGCHRKVPA